MSDIENIWDTVKVTKFLGISRPKLYEYMLSGELKPFIKLDRHTLFRRADVEAFRKGMKK